MLAINLAAFQAAWFACVLGAAHGAPLIGVAAAAAAVAWQLAVSDARAHDAALTLLALALGLAWDTAMARMGLVVYASPGAWPDWAPGWMLALWALLASTLRGSLRWLQGRWPLSALVGGVGGALSYAGAVRLGAGQFPDVSRALWVLALGWAAILPVLTESARRLNARASGLPGR